MRKIMMLTTALTLALSPVSSMANPGNGNGNGNGHGKPHAAEGNGHGNPHALNENGNHGCPPGLARRDPACVPPGLARQGIDTEDWIGPITTDYIVGDILDLDDFVTITDLRKYGLPALDDGEQYAIVDGTVVKIDSDTYAILELIRVATSVFQ